MQYCSGFCNILTWISHGSTCVPHPDSPLLPPSPSHPSGSSQCSFLNFTIRLKIMWQNLFLKLEREKTGICLKRPSNYFLNNPRRIYVAAPFLIFWGASTLFSKVAVPVYIPTNSAGGFPLHHSLFSIILFVDVLVIAILTGVRQKLTVVLICISLTIRELQGSCMGDKAWDNWR